VVTLDNLSAISQHRTTQSAKPHVAELCSERHQGHDLGEHIIKWSGSVVGVRCEEQYGGDSIYSVSVTAARDFQGYCLM